MSAPATCWSARPRSRRTRRPAGAAPSPSRVPGSAATNSAEPPDGRRSPSRGRRPTRARRRRRGTATRARHVHRQVGARQRRTGRARCHPTTSTTCSASRAATTPTRRGGAVVRHRRPWPSRAVRRRRAAGGAAPCDQRGSTLGAARRAAGTRRHQHDEQHATVGRGARCPARHAQPRGVPRRDVELLQDDQEDVRRPGDQPSRPRNACRPPTDGRCLLGAGRVTTAAEDAPATATATVTPVTAWIAHSDPVLRAGEAGDRPMQEVDRPRGDRADEWEPEQDDAALTAMQVDRAGRVVLIGGHGWRGYTTGTRRATPRRRSASTGRRPRRGGASAYRAQRRLGLHDGAHERARRRRGAACSPTIM